MIPLGMKGSKLISDMLTDTKVSYFDRQRQYVLLNNDLQIIWLLGRRIDDRYKITSSTKNCSKNKVALVRSSGVSMPIVSIFVNPTFIL